MARKKMKVPVQERALLTRINRKLAPDKRLHVNRRDGRAALDLGRYYVIRYGGAARSRIIEDHVDLEDFARDLGVLAAHEEVSR